MTTATDTINKLNGTSSSSTTANKAKNQNTVDQTTFLKLLTTQMQQQDPFNPVDQKEMLAQMAQFSSLAGTTEMADTLSAISAKLDTLVSAQTTTNEAVTALAQKVASTDAATPA